jgi:uncharacterized membrane protein
MSSVLKKIIFLALYLGVDLCYVIKSNSIYNQAVFSIAHHDMPAQIRQYSILYAYGCMSLGWLFLAVPTAERWALYFYKPVAALLAGTVYGLAVVGTFNFTLNLMFEGWTGAILVRDLSWGISWSALSILIYSFFCIKKSSITYKNSWNHLIS